MVPMTEESHGTTATTGPADLGSAVDTARGRLDDGADGTASIVARTRAHFARLADPLSPTAVPSHPAGADGTAGTPVPPPAVDPAMLRRAALYAADGLVGDSAEFTEECTFHLATLGRDLRKYGVTTAHYGAAAEAAGRAVCEAFDVPYPGADLTYRRAEELGIPDGLTELLQAVDNAVRIVALGAVEDDEAGVPASITAEVLEVVPRTPQVTVVRLQASSPQTGWPGQSLEVRTPSDPDVWHQFASTLPPNDAGYLEFHCPGLTAHVGETWVVANPAGGLGVPTGQDAPDAVAMVALGAGLAALRALVLDVSAMDDSPPVHLFWGVDHSRDLHGLTDLRGLAQGFPWLTFTPLVADEGDPGAAAAAADDPVTHRPGTLVLVSGEDVAGVRDAVGVLTRAGVDAEQIIAEP